MAILANAKGGQTRRAWLEFVFNGTQAEGLLDHVASWPPGGAIANLYISLHTASPGEAGSQTTSEATFGGYGRVAVARSSAGWDVDNPTSPAWQASNVLEIQFPARSDAGSQGITHIGIGSASSGAGVLLYYAPLPSTVTVTQGLKVTLAAGSIVVKET